MNTMQEFIASQGLTMFAKRADSNPNMLDPSPRMNHWRCIIRRGRQRLTVPFSMGSALLHEPTLGEVLDCLASDAGGMENAAGNFEDWCSEYGYEPDSRKAEKTFKIIEKQADKLQRLLGPEAYEALLWDTERL